MTLKTTYAPLTPEQEEKREHRDYYEKKLAEAAAQSLQESGAADIPELKTFQRPKKNQLTAPALETPRVEPEEIAKEITEEIAKESPKESNAKPDAEITVGITAEEDSSSEEIFSPDSDDSSPVAKETTGEETPVAEISESDTFAKDTTGEETPAVEISGTDTFAEDATEKETPVAEISGADNFAEDTTGEETPAVEISEADNFAEDTTVKDTSTEEISEADNFAEDSTGEETPAVESVGNEPEDKIICHMLVLEDHESHLNQIRNAFRQEHEASGIPTAPVARIAAEKVNRAGLFAALKKLNGRDLILQPAGSLEDSVLDQLLEAIEQPPCTAVIVLADTREGFLKLRKSNSALFSHPGDDDDTPSDETQTAHTLAAEALTEKVSDRLTDKASDQPTAETSHQPATEASDYPAAEAPDRNSQTEESESGAEKSSPVSDNAPTDIDETPLTSQEFIEFLNQYALENECILDSMAELALAARVDRMELTGTPLTRQTGIEMMDKAIKKAERFTLGNIFSSRYDKDDYLILKEKHFS